MYVKEISLSDFRNLGRQSVSLSEHVNVFYGENAQGKTNLLESVFLLSCPKGFRQGKDRDYIAFGKNSAKVRLNYVAFGREQQIELSLFSDARKSITLNGIPIRRSSELAAQFCTVLFVPGHLNLVKGGPEERRLFLDTAISQLRPKYQRALADYGRVISQKNMLLKRGAADRSLLEVWNQRLIELGSYLTLQRGSYVRKLSAAAAEHHRKLSRGEELRCEYRWFPGLPGGEGITDFSVVREVFASALKQAAEQEFERGMCLVGPHRDDLELLIDGRSARLFGSQGQQRSVALSLKLGECELVEQTVGESPVLLLDDVMSELDRSRQQYIRSNLRKRQVLITSCARAHALKTAAAFSVEKGKVVRLFAKGEENR